MRFVLLLSFNETMSFRMFGYLTNGKSLLGWLQIVVWDALTAKMVQGCPLNHIGAPRWLDHSPVEAAFVSYRTDRLIHNWKETL